jgi:hypothetical protein
VKVILKTFKGKIGVPSPSLGHSSGNERLTSSFHMHVKVFEEKARAMSGIDQLISINASSTPVFTVLLSWPLRSMPRLRLFLLHLLLPLLCTSSPSPNEFLPSQFTTVLSPSFLPFISRNLQADEPPCYVDGHDFITNSPRSSLEILPLYEEFDTIEPLAKKFFFAGILCPILWILGAMIMYVVDLQADALLLHSRYWHMELSP